MCIHLYLLQLWKRNFSQNNKAQNNQGVSRRSVSVEVYVEAPEQNGFQTGGCRQDLECSPSAARGVVGRTEKSSVVL